MDTTPLFCTWLQKDTDFSYDLTRWNHYYNPFFQEAAKMAVETKPAVDAVAYFEAKLAFEIGPVELKMGFERGEKYQILDLRTAELFAKGHVPTAHLVLLENLDAKLEHLNKDVTTVVYCYDVLCHLSAKAALHLAKKGYKVRELAGGWDGWVERKFAVEGEATKSSCGSSCG